MRWYKRSISGILALALLCIVLLSAFALSTHTCADCSQGRSLCPFALNLREGFQQLARIGTVLLGVAFLLFFFQTLIGLHLQKWHIPSLVDLKARMNN